MAQGSSITPVFAHTPPPDKRTKSLPTQEKEEEKKLRNVQKNNQFAEYSRMRFKLQLADD